MPLVNNLRNYAIARGRSSGRMTTSSGFSTGSVRGGKDIYDVQKLVDIDMTEWYELEKRMKVYGISLERRKLISIIKKSAKPTLAAAQRNVAKIEIESQNPDLTGNLYDSLGMFTGKSQTFVNVMVGPRVKRGHKGHHGHFVEFGTTERRTRGRAKIRSFTDIVAGVSKTTSGLNRGAAKPKPYMEPAYKNTKIQVIGNFKKNVEEYTKEVAEKIF